MISISRSAVFSAADVIFLSLPGCLAYFIFEILPGLSGRDRYAMSAESAAGDVPRATFSQIDLGSHCGVRTQER